MQNRHCRPVANPFRLDFLSKFLEVRRFGCSHFDKFLNKFSCHINRDALQLDPVSFCLNFRLPDVKLSCKYKQKSRFQAHFAMNNPTYGNKVYYYRLKRSSLCFVLYVNDKLPNFCTSVTSAIQLQNGNQNKDYHQII